MKEYNVAVVGATGAVGKEMLKTLEQRNFPVKKIVPLASWRSVGKKVKFKNKELEVLELKEDSFKDPKIDIALFSAGGSISQKFAPLAAKDGAIVIDNTSAFRMDPEVPLVVPEVNAEAIKEHKGIIANPNCSTIQMVLALKPIHDISPIKRVVVSTYQAVSGAGSKAIFALAEESKDILDKKIFHPIHFPFPIGFNLLPHIDVFLDNDYTKEEMKMTHETKKILGDDNVLVTATCVRVPVFVAHSEAVNIETEKPIEIDKIKDALDKAEGVTLWDDVKENKYPFPLDVAGKDDVYVGRIRQDNSKENAINLWVVGDNLRKGAALNAIQIAETFVS
ncbi:aspartate-semialdehyde dehydrogenase [Candidatus Auribacterota bacterium]